jgi:hypothetical protein
MFSSKVEQRGRRVPTPSKPDRHWPLAQTIVADHSARSSHREGHQRAGHVWATTREVRRILTVTREHSGPLICENVSAG